jgi:hypothetical protein
VSAALCEKLGKAKSVQIKIKERIRDVQNETGGRRKFEKGRDWM